VAGGAVPPEALADVGTIVHVRGMLVGLVLALVLGALPAQAGTRDLQHVTVIGDSVADGMRSDNNAIPILRQGIDLDLEVAACRRVDQQSCTAEGVQPPNVVQLVKTMGSKLGPNVVIAVGYNDYEDQYAQNIQTALAALQAAGVKHIWWLTLRAAHHGYVNMNDDIVAAAQSHPQMSVIDWNVYSRSHPDWFQADGLHLLQPGSEAMATLIHQSLLDDGVAARPVQLVTKALPVARRGKSYHATLQATSGDAPYRWSLLARAPRGMHLEAKGAIIGKPLVKPGAYVLNVRVKDSDGSFDTRRITLRVKI
jgi:putative Ig domain-containing protein